MPIAPAPFAATLRSRRKDCGLSQTELAGEQLSASYVSLLEAGKRTPTPQVLSYLAERLGCSEDFLRTGVEGRSADELALEIRYAQLALHSGEAAEAERRFRALVTDPVVGRLPEIHARAQAGLAQSLESLGLLEQAVAAYEELLDPGASDPDDGWLAVVIALSRCYREAGDLNHSVALAERSLARAQALGLGGTDEEIELAATLVAAYHERGDLTRARVLAAQVVARAERGGSLRARGAAYWNASLVADAKGLPVEALRLADRALALYSEGEDGRPLARLRSAYAWVLLRQPDPDANQALALLTKAAEGLEESGSQVDLAYCDVESARAMLLLGRAGEALAMAQRGLGRLGSSPRLEAAAALVVLGRALLALGEHEQAVAAYRKAGGVLEQAGSSREAAALWCELAELFVAVADAEGALDAYRRAAAHLGMPTASRLPVASTDS